MPSNRKLVKFCLRANDWTVVKECVVVARNVKLVNGQAAGSGEILDLYYSQRHFSMHEHCEDGSGGTTVALIANSPRGVWVQSQLPFFKIFFLISSTILWQSSCKIIRLVKKLSIGTQV